MHGSQLSLCHKEPARSKQNTLGLFCVPKPLVGDFGCHKIAGASITNYKLKCSFSVIRAWSKVRRPRGIFRRESFSLHVPSGGSAHFSRSRCRHFCCISLPGVLWPDNHVDCTGVVSFHLLHHERSLEMFSFITSHILNS